MKYQLKSLSQFLLSGLLLALTSNLWCTPVTYRDNCPNKWPCPPKNSSTQSPGLAAGAKSTGATVGDPIYPIGALGGNEDVGGVAVEDVVDFSVPVKHGLSLDVRRTYSDVETTDENSDGEESLGYNNIWMGRNWRLYRYESSIKRQEGTNYDPQNPTYNPNTLLYFDELGRSVNFGFFITETYSDAKHAQLRLPWDPSTVYTYVSVFKPWGTEIQRNTTDPDYTQAQAFNSAYGPSKYFRQITEDLTLYVFHKSQPNPDTRLADDQVAAYVLRNADGQQYYFFGEERNPSYINPYGKLLCYDINWRNNVPQNTNGHVDDYLTIYWRNTYVHDMYNPDGSHVINNSIDKVLAPPSDGRSLQFVHDGDFSNVVAVNLLSPNAKCPSFNVVNYQYITATGNTTGKLLRAWRGNNNLAVQYAYAAEDTSITFTNPPTFTGGTGTYTRLVMVSDYLRSTGAVSARYINGRSGTNGHDLTQYVRDPETGKWRKAFSIPGTYRMNDVTLSYLDGALSDGSGQQYGGTTWENTTSFLKKNYHHLPTDTHATYGNNTKLVQQNYPPPRVALEYMSGTTTVQDDYNKSNLLNREWLFVGTDPLKASHWVVGKEISYVGQVTDNTGNRVPSGIAKVKSVKLYPDWTVTNGVYSNNPGTAQTTTFEYGAGDADDQVSAIVYYDGHREEFLYDSADRLTTHTVKNIGGTVRETTEFFYRITGRRDGVVIDPKDVNYGLLDKIRVTPYGKTPRETTYVYTSGTDKYPDGISARPSGMIKSITIDGRTTSFSYDDFGNVTSVVTPEGTSTYTYSGKNESDGSNKTDASLPPRLLTAKDPLNAVTSYAYDDHGRVWTVTAPNGKTSQYTYDLLGNVSKVSTSGMDDVVSKYDIYGRLVESRGDSKSCTRYSYDAFGRLITEKVMNAAGSAPLYTVNYIYAQGIGTAAGERDLVAMREITDDPTSKPFDPASFTAGKTHEFTYTKYDMLGRPVSHGQATSANFLDILNAMRMGMSDSVNDDVRYTYDTAGRLRFMNCKTGSPSALWAFNCLEYKYDSMGRLWREVYPDGRYNEYSYDQAGWMTSVKDPFGFVNQLQYLSDGRLSTLNHSKLGVATYTYDPDAAQKDWVTRLSLSNNLLHTDYTYDSIGRLNGFTHAKSDGTELMHQDWSYSATTGLKNTANITAVNLGAVAGDTLATAYDTAASGRRLASETLKLAGTQRWSQTYGYDNAENRTSLNLSGTAYTFGYNGGDSGQNRETSVSPGTPLLYDFKGNVTDRTPLAGGNLYKYTWNCYDQLTSSTRSGGATVDYTYDPLGRQVKRARTIGANTTTTLSYWLGGCKIAEARWGSEYGRTGGVLRPDPNETGVPTANGWGAVTGTPDMHYETDGLRGTVLRLKAATTGQYDLNVMNGDYSLFDYNPNDTPFLDTTRRHLGFWVKNNKAGQAFEVMVALKGASGNLYCLRYYTDDGVDSYGGAYALNTHIGTRFNNGGWHYVEVDVAAKFAEFSQTYLHGEALAELEGVAFLGNDLSLDDLAISGTAFCRSYQVVPGATVGGVLGGYALDAAQAEDRWYYQYNELGTVVATAWSSGNPRSLDVPDYFGNYRANGKWGTRPDTLGLTGKFLDDDNGLYYFGARWFDPERGRWMSEEPLGLDGPNAYQFCFNNPAMGCDPNGLFFTDHPFYYNLKSINNFIGGMGDKLTFGGTRAYRQSLGGGDTVNYCTTGYSAGAFTGAMVRDTIIAGAVAKGLSAAGSYATSQARLMQYGCFVPGTRVLTENGLKPIEQVAVGDLVVACDTQTGQKQLKRVEEVFVRTVSELVDLVVADAAGTTSTITGTAEHPFFVPALGGYVPMGLLQRGTRLHPSVNAQLVTVVSTRVRTGQFTVHNLRVDGDHNYYVASASGGPLVLVHNNPCAAGPMGPYSALRRMLAGTGLQAHHLLEQRFARLLGLNARQMLSIALTPSAHQAFTLAWRQAIAYGTDYNQLDPAVVYNTARDIYQNYPNILAALGL